MPWQLAVVLRIIVVDVIHSYLNKKIAIKHRRTQRFFLQFCFCSVLGLILVILSGGIKVDTSFLLIMGIGFLNGFAAYFSWRAVAISLSRNALFTFWDDLIAMTLGYLILGEVKLLNIWLITGVSLSFIAVITLVIVNYQRSKEKDTSDPGKHMPMKFFVFVGIYSVIWGVAIFAMRYWGLKEVSLSKFGFGWYGGASIAAFLIFLFYKDPSPDQQDMTKLTSRDVAFTALLAVIIFVALMLGYIGYRGAPITVIQPIFLSSQMILPSIVGLLVFREKRHFGPVDWWCFWLGFIGAMMIAWNF